VSRPQPRPTAHSHGGTRWHVHSCRWWCSIDRQLPRCLLQACALVCAWRQHRAICWQPHGPARPGEAAGGRGPGRADGCARTHMAPPAETAAEGSQPGGRGHGSTARLGQPGIARR
jgi:hypothetical protein